MADETKKPAGKGGPRRLGTVNVGKANVGTLKVTRFDSVSGDQKSPETDLLSEIRAVITEQTKTLKDSLDDLVNEVTAVAKAIQRSQKNINDGLEEVTTVINKTSGTTHKDLNNGIAKALEDLNKKLEELGKTMKSNNGGIGGGGHDEGGHGITPGDIFRNRQRYQNVRDIDKLIDRVIRQGSKNGISSRLLLGSAARGARSEFQLIRKEQLQKIQAFGQYMVQWSNVTKVVSDKFTTYLRLSSTGLGSFKDILGDLLPSLVNGGDNLKDTMDTVTKAIDEGMINPIGVFGKDMVDVAQTFRQTRQLISAGGFNLNARMGFKEQQEVIEGLFDEQRRANYLTQINTSETQQQFQQQLKYLDLISVNTGRTVDEIIKGTQQDRRDLANLQASGVISQGTRLGYDQLTGFAKNLGANQLNDILLGLARSGGNASLYKANNPELTAGLAYLQQGDLIDKLANLASNQRLSPDDKYKQLQQLNLQLGAAGQARGGQNGNAVAAVALSPQVQALLGETGLFNRDINAARPGDETNGASFWNKLVDFFTNTLPLQNVAMVTALIANTAATVANTVALGGGLLGGIGGMIGKGGRGLMGLLGFGRKAATAAGGTIAGAVAGDVTEAVAPAAGEALEKVAGKGLAGVAGKVIGGTLLKSIVKGLPLVGLGIGLYDAVGSAMKGDWTGAGLNALAGGASLIPGVGTVASLGLSGYAAYRDYKNDEAAAGQGAAGDQTPAEQMDDQTSTLTEIRDLMRKQVLLTQDMVIMAKTGGGKDNGWFDRVFGSGDVALYSPISSP